MLPWTISENALFNCDFCGKKEYNYSEYTLCHALDFCQSWTRTTQFYSFMINKNVNTVKNKKVLGLLWKCFYLADSIKVVGMLVP